MGGGGSNYCGRYCHVTRDLQIMRGEGRVAIQLYSRIILSLAGETQYTGTSANN